MNAPLRRVAVVVIVLFSMLFLNLVWVQFVQHDFYKYNDYNSRVLIEEYARERGSITAGGVTLAHSVATEGEEKDYRREYPTDDPQVYAALTGYKMVIGGSTGIERAENGILSGDDNRLFTERFKEMLTGEQMSGGNVVLSVDPELQEAAWSALGSSSADVAAAVLSDPESGEILAQVSTPSYDPNPLADHDTSAAHNVYDDYDEADDRPLLDRATQETFPPGSTMKVVVAAAALEAGMSPDTMVPAGNRYEPPNTNQPVTNARNQCPESQLTLKEAFSRSCNTTFAQLCVEDFDGMVDSGADAFRESAEAFGFGEEFETPMPGTASSVGDVSDPAFLAQACFGQHESRQTPLQAAMISAAIANDGEMRQPHVVSELQGPDLSTVSTMSPSTLNDPVSGDVAADLREIMEEVVDSGTGTDAQVSGATVGGKTGTAESGDDAEHGWFTGYAMDDDGEPAVAVTVFLANVGTGGSPEAAQIAGNLMQQALDD